MVLTPIQGKEFSYSRHVFDLLISTMNAPGQLNIGETSGKRSFELSEAYGKEGGVAWY